ncbi:MAG: hypothetical protein Kow0073_08180 [Immundisolibacter sp.]
MGVYDTDRYPRLVDEIRLIEAAIGTGKQVLGICLGAQLIAAALGARVYPSGRHEIGWFPIAPAPQAGSPFVADLPNPVTVFHWHGDTFDLPNGARQLARNAHFEQQAFSYGQRVLALQCHPQMDPAGVSALTHAFGAHITPGPSVQPVDVMRRQTRHFEPARRRLWAWLTPLAA